MKIGMLWFDNNPKMDLDGKIALARAYYQNKYGKVANMIYVNPSMLPPQEQAKSPSPEDDKFSEYVVRGHRAIMPNHFWIGIETSPSLE